MLTAGLKCAPDTGPKIRMRTGSIAPVASALQSSASATFPPVSRSAMMPEPITVASSSAVPSASASARCAERWTHVSALRRGGRAVQAADLSEALFAGVSWSRLFNGSAMKIPMRWCSIR